MVARAFAFTAVENAADAVGFVSFGMAGKVEYYKDCKRCCVKNFVRL